MFHTFVLGGHGVQLNCNGSQAPYYFPKTLITQLALKDILVYLHIGHWEHQFKKSNTFIHQFVNENPG